MTDPIEEAVPEKEPIQEGSESTAPVECKPPSKTVLTLHSIGHSPTEEDYFFVVEYADSSLRKMTLDEVTLEHPREVSKWMKAKLWRDEVMVMK